MYLYVDALGIACITALFRGWRLTGDLFDPPQPGKALLRAHLPSDKTARHLRRCALAVIYPLPLSRGGHPEGDYLMAASEAILPSELANLGSAAKGSSDGDEEEEEEPGERLVQSFPTRRAMG